MSQSYIAATRQELLKLKDKYKSAKRGHKLLKDKRDSLIQIFMKTYKEAALMRAFFDKEYINSRERFKLATSNINDIYLKAVAKTTESRILIEKSLEI